jgi:hypothetical protein
MFRGFFKAFVFCIFFFTFYLSPFTFHVLFAEEYKFDASEIEKKPYHIGGYIEFFPIMFGLDKNAALYKLNFYNRDIGGTTEVYNGNLQLEGSFEAGIARAYIKTYTSYINSYQTETTQTKVFEGNVSIKPTHSFIAEAGKKTLNWGKGYAWNPAAFLDRPKDPNDPELSREGYIVGSVDYTSSFSGPLKTFTFTPVILPVYSGVNDDFGEANHLNFASKFYFLLYDTDIDLMFLTGGSTTTRYGLDFSRNFGSNLEMHGEFSLINDFAQTVVDRNGNTSQSTYSAVNYLLGLRYLTSKDTTFILEYYHNGTGYSPADLRSYFSFIDNGYSMYVSNGNASMLNKAINLSQSSYGRMNPALNYLYLRIIQKDPFDIPYWTPAITMIANTDDKSFSLMPELVYTGITNFELRLRGGPIVGTRGSEYGEKQNDYRIDFRARYYF